MKLSLLATGALVVLVAATPVQVLDNDQAVDIIPRDVFVRDALPEADPLDWKKQGQKLKAKAKGMLPGGKGGKKNGGGGGRGGGGRGKGSKEEKQEEQQEEGESSDSDSEGGSSHGGSSHGGSSHGGSFGGGSGGGGSFGGGGGGSFGTLERHGSDIANCVGAMCGLFGGE